MPATDTTIEAARVQRQTLAGKTADERTRMAFEMSELVRQLVVDGIRQRHPKLCADDFVLKLVERLHGKELADAVAVSQTMEAELLRIVVAALESAKIPHMVTGSLASALHGQPRATRDIDLVIAPDDGTLEILVACFPTDRFYVGDVHSAGVQQDMFNIIDTSSGWKADLIIRKDRPFSREEFARRQPAIVAGIQTYVSTPEDTILSKLEWHTIPRSDIQRRDVIEMILANADTLDQNYLNRWAKDLGLTDILREVREAANDEK